jgi:ferredoxin-NADP reductase
MTSRYRKVLVEKIVSESDSVKSFYLVAGDGSPLPPHLPGQHLPLSLEIAGHERAVFRCYTLSDCANGKFYRLTIKREHGSQDPTGPAGVGSGYFHDHVAVGHALEAGTPSGAFCLDTAAKSPVVMIAGGIGVTPMISMMSALAEAGSPRRVELLFSVQHGGEHPFRDYLRTLAAVHPNFRVRMFYSQPRANDRADVDYERAGRITIEDLREHLQQPTTEYFLCGPMGMMQDFSSGLTHAGVPAQQIRTESFNPAKGLPGDAPGETKSAEVTFTISGVTARWTSVDGTLLEFAEKHGVAIDYGCRYGDCATCLTRVLQGSVTYLHSTGVEPEPGTCLPCSCRPVTDLLLEA